MPGLEFLGVESVFLTQAFSKGLSTYIGGLKSAEDRTKATSAAVTQAGQQIGGPAASALGAFGAGLKGIVGIAGITIAAITGIGAAMAGLALGAAPIEGIEVAFRNMSETAGVSLDRLRKAANGTVSDLELMKNANLALTGTTGEFRKAFAEALPQLLEAARASARATGQDVQFLFESLVTGVKRASPRLIDNTGIVLKLGAANEAMADSMETTVDGLTDEQKQIALLNATLEASQNVIAAATGTQVSLGESALEAKAGLEALGAEYGQALPGLIAATGLQAKETGQDVDTLFQSLAKGLETGNVALVENTGLSIDLAKANEELASSLGKTVGDLTEEEKRLGLLNATMAASQTVLDAQAAKNLTLGTAVQQLRASFQNTGVAVGRFFLPGMTDVVSAVNRIVVAFGAAVSEGGSLYPVMVSLGAVASMVGDAFQSLADVAETGLSGFTSSWESGLSKTVSDAFQWGSDIVIQLAEGMINAASAAINAVANVINNLMGGWFAPGSPPRVLPEIDAWGSSTMEEYLKGFSEADFSVLKNVQSSLKSVFSTFVDQGRITRAQSENIWADISEKMIEGLGTGDLSGAFSAISQTAGEFAGHIIDLTKDTQALAKATQAVQKAETDLENSRKRSAGLETKRARLLREYNDLARQGASPEVLAAKLAEINATEDSLQASFMETAAAESAVEVAKEKESALAGQVKQTEELIKVLTELAKAQAATEPEKAGGKAAAPGAGAGAGMGGFELPTGETIQQKIGEAIDAAKEAAKAKLAAMWQELKDRMAPAIANFNRAWENIKTAVKPVLDAVRDYFRNWRQTLENWWEEHGESITYFAQRSWQRIKDIWNWGTGIIKNIWDFFAPYLLDAVKVWWTSMQVRWQIGLDAIGNIFDIFAAILKGDWETVGKEIGELWQNALDFYSEMFETWKTNLTQSFQLLGDILGVIWKAATDFLTNVWQGLVDGVINIWNTFGPDLMAKISTWWNDMRARWDAGVVEIKRVFDNFAANLKQAWTAFGQSLKDTWQAAIDFFSSAWETFKTGLKNQVNVLNQIGKDVITGLWDGAKEIWKKVTEWLSGVVTGLKDLWMDVTTILSGIGGNIISGLLSGMQSAWDSVTKWFQGAISGLPSWVKKFLGIASDSKVMIKIGEEITSGLATGVATGADKPQEAMASTVGRMMQPAMAAQSITTNYNNSRTVNMGGVTIQNNLDQAQLASMIRRVIRQGV